jgi:hypothetical protein
MRVKVKANHCVKHIWEAYAKRMLDANPTYRGKRHNKISNFYIYKRNKEGKLEEVISYTTFRAIVERFFDRAKVEIIKGKAVSINGCGRICAKRVERDFRSKRQKMVDWGKTRQQTKIWSEEKQRMVYPKLVFFTSSDWIRIAWYKSTIRNNSYYEFRPTEGNKFNTGGFTGEISSALNEDKLLRYQYLYVPLSVTAARRQRSREFGAQYTQKLEENGIS